MLVEDTTDYSQNRTDKNNKNDTYNYNRGKTLDPETVNIQRKNDIENKIQSRINGDQRLGINTNTDEYKKATELFENALNNGEDVNENTQMLEQPVYLKYLEHKFNIIISEFSKLNDTLENNIHIKNFLSKNYNRDYKLLSQNFQELLEKVDDDLNKNSIKLENKKIKMLLLYFCIKKSKQDFFIKVSKDNDIENNLEYYLTNLFEPNPEPNLEQNPKSKQEPNPKNRKIVKRDIPLHTNGGKKTKRIHKKKTRKQKKSKKMRL